MTPTTARPTRVIQKPAGLKHEKLAKSGGTTSRPLRDSRRDKRRLLVAVYILFIILVAIGITTNRFSNLSAGLYVVVLFSICSLPAFFVTTFRGKASLLLVFLAYYFAIYGLSDLVELFSYRPRLERAAFGFSAAEYLILIGAAIFILAYSLASASIPKQSAGLLKRDWSPKLVIVAGVICYLFGSYSNVVTQFQISDQFLWQKRQLGTVVGPLIALFRILGPLGILMLVYSYLRYQSKTALLFFLIAVLANFVLGFLGDTKELAMIGPILYLVSVALMREKLPFAAAIGVILVFGLAFDFFASYRNELSSRHEARTESFQNLNLEKMTGGKKSLGSRFSDGIDYFVSRISLKTNTEIIVAKTGREVKFQNGYTLTPILFAFVPRFIVPDKQDATQTGRMFNREFHISASPDTYISMGQLGEFYWNFGWWGAAIGMAFIGALMALIAGLLRLDTNMTLPRFLVLLLAVYLLVFRYEGGFATTYTYWARAVVLLLLVHLVMPKKSVR